MKNGDPENKKNEKEKKRKVGARRENSVQNGVFCDKWEIESFGKR